VIEPVQLDGPEEIVAPRFKVTGTSKTSAADLLDTPDAEERTELDEAADFLRAELAGAEQAAKKLLRDAPCSERTLRKAKRMLGIEAKRSGFGSSGVWTWSLPKAAPPISEPLQRLENPHDHADPEAAPIQRLQGCGDRGDGAASATPEEEAEIERIAAKFDIERP
jgi:hypothetical protein